MPWLRMVLQRIGDIWVSWSFSWTGYSKKEMLIKVQRHHETIDGIFGMLTLDWSPFTCFTVENKEKCIPAGTYPVEFTYSPKFNMIMPLLDVPGREGIRIHPANWATQLEGCIAVGDKENPDSVDNSRITYNQLFKIINGQKDLKVKICDILT